MRGGSQPKWWPGIAQGGVSRNVGGSAPPLRGPSRAPPAHILSLQFGNRIRTASGAPFRSTSLRHRTARGAPEQVHHKVNSMSAISLRDRSGDAPRPLFESQRPPGSPFPPLGEAQTAAQTMEGPKGMPRVTGSRCQDYCLPLRLWKHPQHYQLHHHNGPETLPQNHPRSDLGPPRAPLAPKDDYRGGTPQSTGVRGPYLAVHLVPSGSPPDPLLSPRFVTELGDLFGEHSASSTDRPRCSGACKATAM